MKKILIINHEMPVLSVNNKRIYVKKGKTIIKDRNFFRNSEFLVNNPDYRFLLEEWEVYNLAENKIQVVMMTDGSPLRPVHICSDLMPVNGAKALFQSEKMIVLRIQDTIFEITKSLIDTNNEEKHLVLAIKEFQDFVDLRDKLHAVSMHFIPVLNSIIKHKNEYRQNYFAPFWYKMENY